MRRSNQELSAYIINKITVVPQNLCRESQSFAAILPHFVWSVRNLTETQFHPP